jgi:hypothetical protein
MIGENSFSILRRLIDSGHEQLSPGAAEAVLHIRFSDTDQARVQELAAKSNRGSLSAEEADEYEAYISAADLLSLWQSKARMSLTKNNLSSAG